jgi:hypothetical protein
MPPIIDQFIDDEDEEEVCPLCVEELDLTDKNFRPCPCGYQVSIPAHLSISACAYQKDRYVSSATTISRRP